MQSIRRNVAWGILGAVVAAGPCGAQSNQPPPGQASAIIPTVSVEFAGGTVGEYVAALKKAAGPATAVNAIVSDAASRMALAAISLKTVSPATALQAIEAAAGSGEGVWVIGPIGQASAHPGVAQAFSVDFRPSERLARGLARRLMVFSLDEITLGEGGLTPDIVLTAIESTLAMQSDPAAKAEMRFHKESGLLVVRGTSQDVEAVAQVLDRLRDDMRRRVRDASRSKQVDIITKANVQRAEIQVRITREEMHRAEQMLREVQAQAQSGHASSAQVREAEGVLSRAKAEHEMAQVELEQAHGEAQASAAGSGDSGEVAQLKALIHQLQDQVNALSQELEQARKGAPRR